MIVDSHAHLVPPDLLAAIPKAKDRFPSLRLIENGGSLPFAYDPGCCNSSSACLEPSG
jgi:aminocarboxymuconate-semialdehyde decarboxylase